MSALVTSCDRECSFVWLLRFVSNVHCDLSCYLTKDVVFQLFVYLVPFH